MLDDELDRAIAGFIEQWNIAEARIKKAEQVRANEVVSSAIFELRYAGRKIVDALHLLLSADWRNDEPARTRLRAFIADATEDCVKAKHDAIDSMMDFVTLWFHEVEHALSLGKLQQFFPDYLETTASIHRVQKQIAESRRDRTGLRDEIYNRIDGPDYERILALFERMQLSKERVSAQVRRENRERALLWAVTILGFMCGIAGLVDLCIRWIGGR